MEELRALLAQHFPTADLDDFYPVFENKPHRRLPLGEGQADGSKKRIRQATRRGRTAFERVFPHADSKVWILINDWDQNEAYPVDGAYLYDLFDPRVRGEFAQRDITRHVGGGQTYQYEQRTIAIPRRQFDYARFMEAKANAAQERLPGVSQMVFFVNPDDGRALFMFDDRCCIVYANRDEELADMDRLMAAWKIVPGTTAQPA